MKHYAGAAVMLIGALLCSCAPTEPPSDGTIEYREAYVKHYMTFHKHPNGLCFAVVNYDRSLSITNIPCISGDTVYVR